MPCFKCVVFDFGDTLVASTEAVKCARAAIPERKVLKRWGYDFSVKRINSALAVMEKESKKFSYSKRVNDSLLFSKLFLKALGLKPSKKLALECENSFYGEKERRLRLLPNAKGVLGFLEKKGVVLAVISNTRNASNLRAAKKFGIRKYFKIFLMSHAFGSPKGDLRIFHHFLEKLNRNRKKKILPEECLMVGNHVEEDGAAKLVGMKVALLKPTLLGKEHLKRLKPDYFLNDLAELKGIVSARSPV